MPDILYTCEVCSTRFPLTKRFQVFRDGERVRYFCSEACREAAVTQAPRVNCEVCGRPFALQYAYQALPHEGQSRRVCSMTCRRTLTERLSPAVLPTVRLCVANQKGGTGKTTTAFHLAAGLARQGLPVLLVDADPQASLTRLFEVAEGPGLAEVLRGDETLLASARRLSDHLHLLPAGQGLVDLSMDRSLDAGVLRTRLAPLTDFRAVIIDPSPASSPLTEATLAFAGAVLVPVSCDYLAIHGVRQLSDTLAALQDRLGRAVALVGVVPTFFDGRTRASRAVIDILERHFPGRLLSPIRASADVRDTGISGRTVFERSVSGRGSHDYRVLVAEVGRRLGLLDEGGDPIVTG